MNISVIVPVLNEEKSIAATLQALARLQPYETIVVDGGSQDRTAEIAAEFDVKVIPSERGRARQMNRGAREASGDVLLFLHADTRLPSTAFSDIAGAMGDPRYVGGRFDVELDGKHWLLPLVGRLISYRSRLSKVATGDQAQFARREVFQRMGGFEDIPLDGRHRVLPHAQAAGRSRLPAQPGGDLGAPLGSGRRVADDFSHVDAEATLSHRCFAGPLETVLCRYTLTRLPSWPRHRWRER